jgi:hypothetical protein
MHKKAQSLNKVAMVIIYQRARSSRLFHHGEYKVMTINKNKIKLDCTPRIHII